MNYMELKNKLHEMIDKVDDPEVLYTIKEMLTNQSTGENREELSDEIKKALDEAIESSRNGKVFSHQQAMQLTKEKFPNLF
jgi:uncharacterized protein YicC (UPF0701 family)